MVKAGKGFTVLPYLTFVDLSVLDQKLLKDFKGKTPSRDIAFVTGPLSMKSRLKKRSLKSLTRIFLKSLKRDSTNLEVVSIH